MSRGCGSQLYKEWILAKNIGHFLYSIAKTWLGGLVLHWTVAYFSFLIPAKKLVETDTLAAFHHPSPSYPLHILILPKGRYRALTDLPSGDLRFEADLFNAVRQLVELFDLQDTSYRLIANGGQAQEVDHLHFHLVAEDWQDEPSSES